MIHQQDEWKALDGMTIYWQEWKPDTGYPHGTILLVHGLGEHSGRYTHVAEAFTAAGYVLTAFDHRGHGRSAGRRGDESMEKTCQDITHFLQQSRQRYPNTPLFLYGHSLGGLMVLYYALATRPAVTGVISTAPALAADKGVSPVTVLMAKVMSRLAPAMQINNGLDRAALSRVPEVVEKYNADALVHNKITARFGLELLQSGKWVRKHTMFPVPLLLITGSADRIIDPQAVVQFGNALNGDVTVSVRDGFYHEVHNEPGQKTVLNDIIQWMDRTAAARAASDTQAPTQASGD